MKRKKRVLSLLLCALMLLTVLPAEVFAAAEAPVLCGAAAVDSVTVSESSGATLSLGVSAQSYQWEIYVPAGGVWAGILGCTGSSMTVTNAMVNNALDGSGTAKVRCAYTQDGERFSSRTVSVGVDHAANAAQGDILVMPVLMTVAAPAMASVEEIPEEEGVRYTISVNYLLEDGSVAANPYTAIIPEGTDFSYTVEHPVIPGYSAYYQDAVSLSIPIEVTAISADVSYTVVYKASDADYTVEHSYQNVGGGYTVEKETRQAKTGSIAPDDLAKVKTGFYALPYVRSTIQADGSTVVKITYNRNYYLLNYDIADGYGTDSVYAQYGATITAPATPTRAGYAFTGWSPAVPGTMPAQNMTCVAQWAVADTKYTIIYWHENADDDGYTQYYVEEKNAYTGQVVSGANITFSGSAHTEHNSYFSYYDAEKNVTVEGDGSTVVQVWYKRKVYTTTFNLGTTKGYTMTINGQSYVSGSNVEQYKIVAKYGASIGHLWPLAENFTVTGSRDPFRRWEYKSGYYWVTKQYYMTDANLLNNTLKANYGSSSEIIVYYMLESFDQTSPAGGSFEEGNYRYLRPSNGKYYDMSPLYSQKVPSTLKAWTTQKPISGCYIANNADEDWDKVDETGTKTDYIRMYYLRNPHTLYLYSGIDQIAEIKNVLYEQPMIWLSQMTDYLAGEAPPYPSNLEAGGYEFAGWYSTAEYHTGTEVDLTTFTMPDSDAFLYAKWVPVDHTVRTYLTKEAMTAGTVLGTYTATHNTKVTESIPSPENGNDFFVGWFYLKNGVETAFDFGSMPVQSDMQVYAKWSINPVKTYMVHYQLENGTPVAEDTVGEEAMDTVLEFQAKGGTDLYEAYREGYYPDKQTASITVGSDNAQNVITFVYKKAEADVVPYTVRYLEKDTGTALRPDKVVSDNKNAVVTETFEPVSGYIPNAYQQDLVVIPGAENILTFWYEKDELNIRYRISHYIQDVEGDAFTKEYTYTEASARIDTSIAAGPVEIPGFTHDASVAGTVTSAVINAEGAHLKLYYRRNDYPYEIRYLEQGTEKQLQAAKTGSAKYHSLLEAAADTLAGYSLVGDASRTLVIDMEEGTAAEKNILTFYYSEKEAQLNYMVVGPEGCGTVTPESETVPVVTGAAKGSTAKVSGKTYRFLGWYLDEDCTKPVPEAQVSGNTVIPIPNSTTDQFEDATYYAKFEYNVADLTIKNSGVSSMDNGAAFVFHISGEDVDLNVVVCGNGSVTVKDLVSGTYTVQLVEGYWRYGLAGVQAQEVTLSGQPVTVPFTVSREEDHWLDDFAVKLINLGQ